MVAYFDAEFNTSSNYYTHQTDMSLIELAIVICEDEDSTVPVHIYHTYVKPKYNRGHLYKRIANLTHISQEDIDNGVSAKQCFNKITSLIKKYHIKQLLTWGDYDKTAMRWNAQHYGPIYNSNAIVRMLTDISHIVPQTAGITKPVSLENMCYICNCEESVTHSALDDAMALMEVCVYMRQKRYNEELVKRYKTYVSLKGHYNTLKSTLTIMERAGIDIEKMLGYTKTGKSLPGFKEFSRDDFIPEKQEQKKTGRRKKNKTLPPERSAETAAALDEG